MCSWYCRWGIENERTVVAHSLFVMRTCHSQRRNCDIWRLTFSDKRPQMNHIKMKRRAWSVILDLLSSVLSSDSLSLLDSASNVPLFARFHDLLSGRDWRPISLERTNERRRSFFSRRVVVRNNDLKIRWNHYCHLSSADIAQCAF